MNENADAYIFKCKKVGILTEEDIRKYPLRSANLACVLKAYAISARLPFTIDNHNYSILDEHKLYLTDGGLEWLLEFFKQYDLSFLRYTFQFLFAMAKPSDIANQDYQGYQNFKGVKGEKPKAGTKQRAFIERCYGKNNKIKKTYEFDNIREARLAVLDMTRFYPADQFKLYRIRLGRRNGKDFYSKSEIPLFIEKSKRGAVINLPNVRRDDE